MQDHQQAMKLANPIVDLEETVRRGINDPLADPQFVMNKINRDYFHLPLTTSSHEESRELLSYQQGGVGVSGRKLRPSAPEQEQAVKEQFVAKSPSIFRPIFQSQHSQPSIALSQNKKMLLHPLSQIQRAVNAARRANVLQKLKLLKTMRNENNILPAVASDNINPLTGLPNDLETSSFGAVSSITAVSDNHNAHPATVTVDLTKTQGISHQNLATAASLVTPKKSQSLIDNLKLLPSEQNLLDNNIDSLKSYLEEDNMLRDKLGKNGLESVRSLSKRSKLKSYKVQS